MEILKPAGISQFVQLTFGRALNRKRRRPPMHAIAAAAAHRPLSQSRPPLELLSSPYRARLATGDSDRMAAYRLRFQVFNLELNEGLEQAYATGIDTDEFDPVCDHIIVENECNGEIVGTYRLQTGTAAALNIGFYSAREFDFSPYDLIRGQTVELGRACIHPDHRKYEVLMLLWKAVTRYATERHARYLIGCSSLSSQDVALGSGVYEHLKSSLAPEAFRTVPSPSMALPLQPASPCVIPPKLLRTYVCLGAWICGEPAIDREFKTIDFLTLLDLNNLSPAVRSRLLD